jgi:hypothetical protein
MHDQQVAGTVVGDLDGDAAQQEPLAPSMPRLPTTTRSALTSSATSRIADAGSPKRIYLRRNPRLAGAVGGGAEHRLGDVGGVDLRPLVGPLGPAGARRSCRA